MDILSLALAAKGGGSSAGGVIPDWNQNDETASDYIKNRPGGYTISQPAIDIEWDGVIGDKVTANADGVTVVKVSDEMPTKLQLIGANITYTVKGSTQTGTLTEESINCSSENFIFIGDFVVICLVANSSFNGLTFPESGVYFVYVPSVLSVSKMFAEERELAIKISKDYLEPTTIVLNKSASNVETGDAYKVEIVYDEDDDALKTYSLYKENGSKTRYFVMNGDKELILASSTANSTKRFKITVDDTGTISATEVT